MSKIMEINVGEKNKKLEMRINLYKIRIIIQVTKNVDFKQNILKTPTICVIAIFFCALSAMFNYNNEAYNLIKHISNLHLCPSYGLSFTSLRILKIIEISYFPLRAMCRLPCLNKCTTERGVNNKEKNRCQKKKNLR